MRLDEAAPEGHVYHDDDEDEIDTGSCIASSRERATKEG